MIPYIFKVRKQIKNMLIVFGKTSNKFDYFTI